MLEHACANYQPVMRWKDQSAEFVDLFGKNNTIKPDAKLKGERIS